MIHLRFIYINFFQYKYYQKMLLFRIAENHIYTFVSYFKSFLFIFSDHFLISSISFLISLFLTSFQISPSIDSSSRFPSSFKAFKASTCFIPRSSIVFICFSSALPSGEYANLACSITLLWNFHNKI